MEGVSENLFLSNLNIVFYRILGSESAEEWRIRK